MIKNPVLALEEQVMEAQRITALVLALGIAAEEGALDSGTVSLSLDAIYLMIRAHSQAIDEIFKALYADMRANKKGVACDD